MLKGGAGEEIWGLGFGICGPPYEIEYGLYSDFLNVLKAILYLFKGDYRV